MCAEIGRSGGHLPGRAVVVESPIRLAFEVFFSFSHGFSRVFVELSHRKPFKRFLAASLLLHRAKAR